MKKKKPGSEAEIKEAEAPLFYMEDGFVVFTREFHLRRGFCCRSGCRHCPYGYEKPANKDKGRS